MIILELIGKGTYGTVHKVFLNSQFFALKTVPLLSTNLIQPSCIIESTMLQTLNHENIVNPISCFHDSKNFSILMPYYEKGILKSSNINKNILELLHVCHYLQQNNIIHGDLKPSNIMLYNDSVRLIDFGISVWKLAKDYDYSNNITSLWWKAPELFTEYDYSNKVDVWSLGVIFYRLVTGKTPFKGLTNLEYLESIQNNLPIIQGENFPHNHLIYNMLVPDPSKRFSLSQCLHYFDITTFKIPIPPHLASIKIPRQNWLPFSETIVNYAGIILKQIMNKLFPGKAVPQCKEMKPFLVTSLVISGCIFHKTYDVKTVCEYCEMEWEKFLRLMYNLYKVINYCTPYSTL